MFKSFRLWYTNYICAEFHLIGKYHTNVAIWWQTWMLLYQCQVAPPYNEEMSCNNILLDLCWTHQFCVINKYCREKSHLCDIKHGYHHKTDHNTEYQINVAMFALTIILDNKNGFDFTQFEWNKFKLNRKIIQKEHNNRNLNDFIIPWSACNLWRSLNRNIVLFFLFLNIRNFTAF